ncbi:myo-inositol-1(or 4)-monophosphatase [Fistulifera solaris]|uniref:Inositol-1-monophosphatase n=1 Tax=Fistulifera solaris TaxID=1519565 RepID=A0A1Z5KEF5_FISSO|nr:myo-inositol-1(or 4)-monophosphatase [Fistulifera solaris]|eukprot:GAX24566.1 myo-inositol-1(or 4)-monophosphatase [Fistulifera solaris]
MVVAQQAAIAAGNIIRSHLGCSSEIGDLKKSTDFTVKTTIKDIVTQYDSQAQHAVEGIIRKAFPEHSFLGEENVAPGASASEQALLDALQNTPTGFVWICDPIDGTANFAAGLPLCGVTVSVIFQGTPIVGVIYDPNADEMFSAIRGHGAYLNNNIPISVAETTRDIKDAIINAGCPSDPNAFAVSMKGVLALNNRCRGLRMIACSALTTAWIAAGRMTPHFGYDLSSWDLVAGALIIHEAGGLVTDLDGSPYKVTTRNMLCSNGAVHDQVLQVLKDADAIAFSRSTS